MIMNNRYKFHGLCIKFKSPNNIYTTSDAQKEMKFRGKLSTAISLQVSRITNGFSLTIPFVNETA